MKIRLFFLLSAIAVAQEVSVFGAGNFDSEKPYGLTKTEKQILDNKNEINFIDSKVKSLINTIESINQRIDGIESIYESDSKKLNDSVLKIEELVKKSSISLVEIEKIKEVSSQMKQIQEENIVNQNKNIDVLKEAISKLEQTINDINIKYVSQNELKKNMNQFATKAELEKVKEVILKEIKSSLAVTSVSVANSNKTSNQEKKLTNKELLIEAKKLYKDDFFTKAIPLFEDLVKKNYKPAESNFYLGEINFYRKNYNNAIKYFKESALLYDQADYMPKLLLHSAISFEKLNDSENASSFYSTLLSLYPNSDEAKEANKNLNKSK